MSGHQFFTENRNMHVRMGEVGAVCWFLRASGVVDAGSMFGRRVLNWLLWPRAVILFL